jgi:hypothetical protein
MRKKRSYAKTPRGRPLLIALAAAAAVAALAGGAFAWTDFTQSRTNRFRGVSEADVTLHDEFDGVSAKHVFVENSGDAAVYVRVRLDEFMQVGGESFDPGADARIKTAWTTHTYDGAAIEDCGHAENGEFHDYYVWVMSGAARDYNPGTPGMVYTRLGADGKVDVTGPKSTAAAASPVKMSDFLAGGINGEAGRWIVDDTDGAENGGGWAYWSVPLGKGEATNLLLESVTKTSDPDDDWIYRIDVKLQAVTSSDFAKWDGGSETGYRLTEGAKDLIELWGFTLS